MTVETSDEQLNRRMIKVRGFVLGTVQGWLHMTA